MKKFLFEVSEYERERILGQHKRATQNLYLTEQDGDDEVGFTPDRPCSQGYFLKCEPEEKISAKAQKRAIKQTNQDWYKEFKAENPTVKDLDFDTFVKMNDEVIKVNNWNKNTWYDKAFDQNNEINDFGKQYSSDIPNWYRYYRKTFGKKEIDVMDLYNHWKSKGGLNIYNDANKNGYDLSSVRS